MSGMRHPTQNIPKPPPPDAEPGSERDKVAGPGLVCHHPP